MGVVLVLTFQVLSFIASASAGFLLYALWKKTGDLRAKAAFGFYAVFFLVLGAELVRVWLVAFVVGAPLDTPFSFADYPGSYSWFYPTLVIMAPFSIILIPPSVVPIVETVFGGELPKSLKRALYGFTAVALIVAVVVAIVYYRADFERTLTPALRLGLGAATWTLTIPIYASLGAFGVYGYAKRREIRDERVASGVVAFVKALAVILPLIFLEQVLGAFRTESFLSRLWFSAFPIGFKFESILFLAVAMICQKRVVAVLLSAAPLAGAGSDAESRRVLDARFAAAGLSKREAEIALLTLNGSANKDIATELGISHATVKNHLTSAYRKLGVSSRWELLAIARIPRL